MNLTELIDGFSRLRVAVVGEAMLDSYVEGSADRLSQEAPVPVVAVARRFDLPGGAANTAVNLAALGAEVRLLSVVGADEEADRLAAACLARSAPCDGLLRAPGRRTLCKARIVANGHMVVRVDQGSTDPVQGKAQAELVERLEVAFKECDAVVVSDYAYGVLTREVISRLGELQARNPRLLLVDSGRLADWRQVEPVAVKPNYLQATRLLGLAEPSRNLSRAEWMVSHGDRLLEAAAARLAAVTLDSEGALVFERGMPPYRTYARPQAAARASGAGDTFAAAFGLALAAGAPTPSAAELASAAASVVVGAPRTVACSAAELKGQLAEPPKFVHDWDELAARLELARTRGQRIAFTNGCFDILHRGHVSYLSRAKALADVLVVGVNTDEGVARLKGSSRPVNPLEDRVQVLSALSSVDLVTSFADDTPERLIRRIRPDVFAKGGDYHRDLLPEAAAVEELGGTVMILPYEQDRSTTEVIARIRDGSRGAATARLP